MTPVVRTETLFKRHNPHHFVEVYCLIEPDGQVALIASALSVSFDKIEQLIRKDWHS